MLPKPDGGDDDWVESFPAWVWEPPYFRVRLRGLYTADLHVRRGGFTVEPRRLLRYVRRWQHIDYDWPAVVVETLLPLGGPGLLFEMSGRLARCQVRREGARLREALSRAGLAVVEFRHWGWEAPRRVPPDVLGEQAANVPAVVVAPVR